ncbi:hypothetical protein EWM64_g3876 [Hericium alpestre]|uniref:Uncharacterized protein n=1 Tax=Hericium alpestre TaxID=135208 RepID=A0A4Y9ZZ63_9AGAM|nr:hypothetical protein EWM64_g3876 [Hericium alpestre]
MNLKFEVPSEQDGPLMQAEYSAATPWTDLAIDNAEGSALYVPWIASLAASPALTYLRSYSPIAQAILSGPFEFQKLKILHARGCHDWLGLGAVLNSTPGVTSLTISQAAPFPTTADGRILRLASDALPNLETLHCPSALVGELLIGRPVHDLHVERTGTVNPWDVDEEGMQQMYTEHTPDADVVGLLARSGAPIRRLHISALAFQKLRLEFGYDDAVADHMDGLKHLEKLSFNPVRWFALLPHASSFPLNQMDDMVDVLAPSSRPVNSHVKTVCARLSKTSGELDLQKEYMLVRQYFSLAYPRATKFAFTSHVKWHLHEQRGEPTWIPAVKSSLKDVLRARIMRLGEKGEIVTDIRGFLKGLFTEEELTSPQLRHTLGLEEE